IQKVQFVVAVDEGRPVLTGIYFKTEKDKLIIAGTDGYRMAEQIIKIEKTDDVVCIIPAKSFAEILKLFSAKSDQIKFVINNERNFAKLETEDMQAQFRMIDGEYPDYKAILPDDFSTEVRISSSEFSNGIKLSSIFSRDIGNMIKIVIKDKSIKSLSQPSEAGSNVTEMLGEVDGEDISIAFNAKYLLDFVNNVQTDEVVFKAEGPLKPVLFSRSGGKDYFYLVMPMKATW
ncbi:DNA polymerase III subunit beta, partial [candidate division WWE3 bacterium CG_4_9_14_3_um_filter_34_6]